MKKSDLDLLTLCQHFEVHNRSEGKSERTVGWYTEVLGLFRDWLLGEGISTSLKHLGEDEVRAFILYLRGRKGQRGPASSHTVNNRVRALRAFFAWLHRRGYTDEHRLRDLRPPRVTEKVIEVLTADEIENIFASMNPNTLLGARNTAIYSLMLDTGLRLSEVVTLRYEDVHLEDRYIKVLGKGNKERIVTFGAICQRWVIHYAYDFRVEPAQPRVDNFFLSIDGFPMSSSALRSLTERLSRTAGVPRLHPHQLRHTYATQFLLNGGDVFLLKQNLGHSTLVMVENFVHMASSPSALN
jgi:site-specific recombinase XerD